MDELGPHPAVPNGREDVELQRVMALGWRGLEEEHLGGWVLRAGGGWTGRANSVLSIGSSGITFNSPVAHVEHWYLQRGLMPRFEVPRPACDETLRRLLACGWTLGREVDVLTVRISDALELIAKVHPDSDARVYVDSQLTDDWLSVYRQDEAPLPSVAPAILRTGGTPAFLSAREGDITVAVGRAVVNAGWVGVAAVEVVPSHRRRGLGSSLLVAGLRHGRAHGAHRAYLQVNEDNVTAKSLYHRSGFTRHHGYCYLQPG